MKKIFKGWNIFEIVFLFSSFFVITFSFLFLPDKNWISFICSILGIFAVLLVSKGIVFAPIINLIYGIFYIFISITQKYYGEAIIYGFIMTPLYISSIISWLKNTKSETENIVKINKIKTKEYIIVFILAIFLSMLFYYVLKKLNTSELIVSTLSFTTSALATYLMFRRCSYYAVCYIIDDIISIVLWSLSIASSGIEFIPSVLCFFIFLINDIYGFIRWKNEEKQQFSKIE